MTARLDAGAGGWLAENGIKRRQPGLPVRLGLYGLCQPGPVEQGGIGLEALIGKALVDGQKQGSGQADAVGVAHHHLAAIGAQSLLQLRRLSPVACPFSSQISNMVISLDAMAILFPKAGRQAIVRSDSVKWIEA